ncbi:MAG: hypothetical protein R2714_07825 [Microthrixaceae bacterium]|nr:hypothetical protein [Microthrixaceae bacterium]
MGIDRTMDAESAHDAWRAFTEVLAGADAVLGWDDVALDDLDRAEGLRYLARLLEVGLGARLDTASPRHPAFRLLSQGFGMDNPDNHYLGAPVDPKLDYVIRGRVGTLSYLSFAAQNQNYSRTEEITGGAGHLHARELEVDSEGHFEIVASVHERPGNWLRMADDTSLLLARQTRADPATEQFTDLTIECVESMGPPPVLDPRGLPDRLATAALFAVGASQWFCDWVSPWMQRPNSFELADPDEQRRMGGDPNILAQSGYWTLEPGESLEVYFEPPPCTYWNIQLANVWAESLDTRRQVWLNNTTAALDAGVARFVIAHEDPGVANWLDTSGHRHGLMHIRFVESDSQPLATTRLLT